MARIVISANASLDWRVEDPGGDEGFARGGWLRRVSDADRAAWLRAQVADARSATALLLGRRSYEIFTGLFAADRGELADRLNELPKHVVSSTIADLPWENSAVLTGAPADAIAALKRELDGELLVWGSAQLVALLIEHDLADELRVVVYPVVLGAGLRLFDETSERKPVRLVDTEVLGEDLVRLNYAFGGAPGPTR